MTILACDPGLRGAGIAYFNDKGTLIYADYIRNPYERGDGPTCWFALADKVFHAVKDRQLKVDAYICEVPQVYRISKGNPNDLIEVAAVAAAIGATFPLQRAVAYKPREWKGSVKKLTHHPRILAQLTPEELECIREKRKTYVHNTYDAIGIGLHELERLRIRMPKWVDLTR